jgi:hypothetical protein
MIPGMALEVADGAANPARVDRHRRRDLANGETRGWAGNPL